MCSYLTVVSTRTNLPPLSLLLHAFLPRCYGELGRPRASRTVTSYLSISCYQGDDVKTYSCVLRYVALFRPRLRHILRSASSAHPLSLYLHSGTIRHVLTARCLSAAYPGIQPTVLYLLLTLPPSLFCNGIFHFANLLLNLSGGGVV